MNPTSGTTAHTTTTTLDMVAEAPQTPTSPSAPNTPDVDSSPLTTPNRQPTEPLYTEINIPLPPLPRLHKTAAPPTAASRPRAHTLSTFRGFHRRGSSSDSTSRGSASEEWPRIKKQVKSREVAAAMNLTTRHHRSATVEALAVVPAILMLSAELFTPGEEGQRKKGGRWEDGMI